MSARHHRGTLAAVLASVGSFLVEPADRSELASEPFDPEPEVVAPPRPVIAVFGLAPGSGSTVVARALAAELARRDPAAAATVACESRARAVSMVTRPASRLARLIEEFPGAVCRGAGRLCLVHGADPAALAEGARHLAPLVIDAGSSAVGGVPAAIADHCLLVTTSALEPALARVASQCLARVGSEPQVVVNRVPESEVPRRLPPECVRLPESRLGAQLAFGGREPLGELGRAVAGLADRCAS